MAAMARSLSQAAAATPRMPILVERQMVSGMRRGAERRGETDRRLGRVKKGKGRG